MKKIIKDQVIQKLKELGTQYKSVEIKNGYVELKNEFGQIRILTTNLSHSTGWLELQSWSVENNYVQVIHFCGDIKLFTPDLSSETPWVILLRSWSVKNGYVELICKDKIYFFSKNLRYSIKSSSRNYKICKFPELKENEKIFSHDTHDVFRSKKHFKEDVIESDKGDILIISESLDAFVSQVIGFSAGCASYTHIDKFADLYFVKCKVADPYIILLKPTNKIHRKNNDFYFGFETFSGLKFFAKIDGDGEIKVSF